jgi:thiamine-monophosphate kinase
MGAKPLYVLLGISIPKGYSDYANTFLNAFIHACKEKNIIIIGGDTTGFKGPLVISVSVIGVMDENKLKKRSTARPGDKIGVVGWLGYAMLGFEALENNWMSDAIFIDRFLMPQALIEEGEWLGLQKAVTSMMDISDGLYTSLKELTDSSQVGVDIFLETLDPNPSFISACKTLKKDPLHTMLKGGEDYALLCTVSNEAFLFLQKEFQEKFNAPFKAIGVVTQGIHPISMTFYKKGKIKKLDIKAFDHFC